MNSLNNKKKFDNCLVTYSYKGCEKYFDRFEKTISNQKYKSFDVLIFNDKCKLKDIKINNPYKIINYSKGVFKNRINSLKVLLKMNYKKAHFLDFDDTMSKDRILKFNKVLNKYNLVFCNIHTRNKKKIIYKNYFSKFLKKKIFYYSDLIHQNLLGFSNTSINLKNLKLDIKKIFSMKYDFYVSDWPIFFYLSIKHKAYFLKDTYIEYYIRNGSLTKLPIILNTKKKRFILNLKINFYKQFKNLKLVNNELNKLKLIKKNKSNYKNFKLLNKYTGWWGVITK